MLQYPSITNENHWLPYPPLALTTYMDNLHVLEERLEPLPVRPLQPRFPLFNPAFPSFKLGRGSYNIRPLRQIIQSHMLGKLILCKTAHITS